MVCSRYRIVVEGELDALTASAFADLRVECARGMTTLWTGDVDQAALASVLDRLRAVGAVLVGLDRAEVGAAPAPSA